MTTHLRGTRKTACGLNMWTTNTNGETVTAVDSVGDHRIPGQPVTCPACLEWVQANYQKETRP